MSDFTVEYESGQPIYFVVFDQVTGLAWNGEWVDRLGNWLACSDAMDDDGEGLYSASMPDTLPSGTWLAQAYLEVGIGRAEGDPIVGTGLVAWPGATEPLPGSEFTVEYESGLSLYAVIYDPITNLAWNGIGFATPTPESWASFVISMEDDGEGRYTGRIPIELPPSDYRVDAYLPAGVPAITDSVVGTGLVTWPGSGEYPDGGGFRAALVARLNNSVTLANLVGDQIFPQQRPQKSSLPAVIYRVPSIDRDHDLDGPTGIATASVDLTAYSQDFTEADRISRSLRDLFDGYVGPLGFGVSVTETLADSEADDLDDSPIANDDGTYSVQVSYQITYRESTPNRTPIS